MKHSKLASDIDKIVIKYKTASDADLVVRATSKSGSITWTDSDTFTTTDTQWANVLAGDEVEVTFKGFIGEGGVFKMIDATRAERLWEGLAAPARTIRRKVRPIGVGDRVKLVNGAEAEVRCVDGNDAWVVYYGSGARATWALSNLTRVTP